MSTPSAELPVPASLAAAIQFTPDGQYLASDSVNAISGSYTATQSGFVVQDARTTLVGYTGSDPTILAVIAGIGAITGVRTGMEPTTVTTEPATSSIRMSVSGYVLTFRNAGPAETFLPPSPTLAPGRT